MHLEENPGKQDMIECMVLTPRSYSMHTEESDYNEQRRADKYNFLKEIKKQATGIANKYDSKPQ